MSVVKKISTGVAWNTASVIIGKVVMFANIFLILNFLTVYEYGFSELVMSVLSVIGIVLLPGLSNTIIADMSVENGRGNYGAVKHIFYQFFYLNLFLGIAAWAVLYFGSHPVAHIFGNDYAAQFLQIASFTFLISPFRSVTLVLATVMVRFFDLSFFGVTEEIFKLALLVLFVVVFHMGIHGLLYAMIVSQLFAVLAYAPRTISALKVFSTAAAFEGSARFWNIVREHRKWSVGASYMGTLATNIRIWIIKAMLGTEAVGLFAFAFGLFAHIASLMPLTSVITPIIPGYVDKRAQLVRILRASLKLQVLAAVAFLIGAYVCGYLFVLILFPKYVAAVPLLYVLLLVLIPNSIAALFNPVFAALKEQKSVLLSNLYKLISTLLILPSSIYFFGVLGIGIEMVLTTIGNTAERYWRLKRLVPEFTFGLHEVIHPDAYEKEAMRTLVLGIRKRVFGRAK